MNAPNLTWPYLRKHTLVTKSGKQIAEILGTVSADIDPVAAAIHHAADRAWQDIVFPLVRNHCPSLLGAGNESDRHFYLKFQFLTTMYARACYGMLLTSPKRSFSSLLFFFFGESLP